MTQTNFDLNELTVPTVEVITRRLYQLATSHELASCSTKELIERYEPEKGLVFENIVEE